MPASNYTIREQVEEALDEWDDEISCVERWGRVFIAFNKTVKVPVGPDCAMLETFEDPACKVDEEQTIQLVMAGRRRWQESTEQILADIVAAEEMERERKQRELDAYRHQLAVDRRNAERDRVVAGYGSGNDRQWHRTGDIGSTD